MTDIVGAAAHHGNVHDQFRGQLTLPEGLRVDERRRPGMSECVGVRVVNDARTRTLTTS